MSQSYDVIIVGGGAIGAAAARELALSGRRVLVLERGGTIGQAWKAAAGLLAPQIEADADQPLLRLGLAARDNYLDLAQALKDSTGIDLRLWTGGIASIARNEAEVGVLAERVRWQQEQGLPSEWLQPEELRRRWPWLGPAMGALWAPQDGALDPRELVSALWTDAERHGARQIQDQVVALESRNQRVTGIRGLDNRYSAPAVIVAAGAWSSQLEGLPRRLPVEPVRGQMIALPWSSDGPPAIAYHQDCYLLARAGEAVLGSTMEYAGYNPEVTPQGLVRILTAGVTLCPALVRAKVKRSWAGLRPVTPDGLPIIGPEPRLAGLWYATGHGRNGILLAGVTGRIMSRLLTGEDPGVDLLPFRPERFEPEGAPQIGA